MKIIKKNNLQDIFKEYDNKNKLVIFGKGPSFQIVSKNEKNDNQIFLCTNDSINYIENCDFLVINDVKNMRKVKKEKLKNLKNLIIPYHIHIKLNPGSKETSQGPSLDYTYLNFMNEFSEYYSGNLIVYNLKTIDKNYPEFINLDSAISSAHSGLEFILNNFKIKKVTTYGIGIKNGYHELFVPTVTKEHIELCCSQLRTDIFRDELKKMTKDITLKIN